MIKELFEAIDARDADGFVSFLAPDCLFRFGNAPEVRGAGEIRLHVEAFFNSIAGLAHRIEDVWDVPGGLVCHGWVSYARRDGTGLTVPFANVFRLGPAGITEYRIFADTSTLHS